MNQKKILKEVVLITGISGAGKSTAIRCLEDMDFFCIDNLPLSFIPNLLENFYDMEKDNISRIAFGIDIREKDFLKNFLCLINYLNNQKKLKVLLENYKVLFFEADDEVLIRRFTETRRKHPLTDGKNSLLIKNIQTERKLLQGIRESVDKIIDTSKLSVNRLKEIVKDYFNSENNKGIIVNIVSFGFKYGIPIDLDMMFDVRFLPNPYYFDDMRDLTGNDEIVQKYVLEKESTKEFIKKLEDMLSFLLPEFIKEGKNYLTIGIGCTGGKHRSVSIVNAIFKKFKENFDVAVSISHRDIEK
jgi:RNase adapter protein RapZ